MAGDCLRDCLGSMSPIESMGKDSNHGQAPVRNAQSAGSSRHDTFHGSLGPELEEIEGSHRTVSSGQDKNRVCCSSSGLQSNKTPEAPSRDDNSATPIKIAMNNDRTIPSDDRLHFTDCFKCDSQRNTISIGSGPWEHSEFPRVPITSRGHNENFDLTRSSPRSKSKHKLTRPQSAAENHLLEACEMLQAELRPTLLDDITPREPVLQEDHTPRGNQGLLASDTAHCSACDLFTLRHPDVWSWSAREPLFIGAGHSMTSASLAGKEDISGFGCRNELMPSLGQVDRFWRASHLNSSSHPWRPVSQCYDLAASLRTESAIQPIDHGTQALDQLDCTELQAQSHASPNLNPPRTFQTVQDLDQSLYRNLIEHSTCLDDGFSQGLGPVGGVRDARSPTFDLALEENEWSARKDESPSLDTLADLDAGVRGEVYDAGIVGGSSAESTLNMQQFWGRSHIL